MLSSEAGGCSGHSIRDLGLRGGEGLVGVLFFLLVFGPSREKMLIDTVNAWRMSGWIDG